MRAELYDAGTRLLKGVYGGGSLLDVKAKPGMNYGSFREIDFEYDVRDIESRIPEINFDLVEEDVRTELLPWPVPFPARMWMDHSPRYQAVDGGPILTVYHRDSYSGAKFEPVPAAETRLVKIDRLEEVSREDARSSRPPSVDEIQDRNTAPTEWLRLDVENEEGAGTTDLREPVVLMHQTDKEGGRVTLSGDFNAITAPFDLRHPEWYRVQNADGKVIADATDDVAKLLAFDPNGFYRLYLRPATWRNVMTVYATYIYISWFEAFPTRQVFTQAYWHRPPIYPKRHNILNPNPGPDGLSYDEAMNIQWDHTRASAFMRHMIIDAQWWTQSEAFIFIGNDPGEMSTTMYPPARGDIVLGVGRVDYPGGQEEVLWIEQTVDGESEGGWQPTLIETFWVPWFVTAEVRDFGF
jgi:hypothetical protein